MSEQTNTRSSVKTTYFKALWLSIALHVVLIIVLFSGDFSSAPKLKPTPAVNSGEPIKAIVVDKAQLDRAINKIKKQKANQVTAEKKRIEEAKKRKAQAAREKARIKKLEAQRKIKEQEKINADKAAQAAKTKAAKAEQLRKQKEQEKQEAEDAAAAARSKRIKEEAEAKKAEELRIEKAAERKRQEIAAKEQAIQDAMLAEQMASEMASRNQARQQQVMTEIERYSALIKQSIKQRMITDRSTMTDKSCRLRITLVSSGFVIKVEVLDGDQVVCDAANVAIGKAGNLPVSKDPEVFKEMRNITITFKPEF